MNVFEQVQHLMREIGPAVDAEAVVEAGERSWILVWSSDFAFRLELLADDSRLVVSWDLGTPDDESRLRVYEAALVSNSLWHQPWATRVALEGPGSDLVQFCEAPLARLDLTTLQTALGELRLEAEAWRQFVSRAGTPAEESSDPPLVPGLRV